MSDAERADLNPSSPSSEADGRAALPAPGAGSQKESRTSGGALVPYPRPPASHDADAFDQTEIHDDFRMDTKAARAPRDWRRLRAAASLAAVVAIGAAAAIEHVHALRVADAGQAQDRRLEARIEALSAKLETLETGRTRDELANIRKVMAEVKTSAASTRDVGGAVGQLAARVERLEKDQSAKLDKLGDRIDRGAATRLADISARLEKLEAKAAAPKPIAKADAAKGDPGISYEPTGAIAKAPPRLRQYWLAEVRNGYAMIDSPMGEFAVSPGDILPGGGGRVLRIERRGRDWAVVTTRGQIVAWN